MSKSETFRHPEQMAAENRHLRARVKELEEALREIASFDWSKDVSDQPSMQDIARAVLAKTGEK